MICVSIANITFDTLMQEISNLEMIELRMDLLSFTEEEYKTILATKRPTIATYRNAEYTVREKALKSMIKQGVKYVDIEIDGDRLFIETMIDFAKAHRTKVILSYHNYEETPSQEQLETIIKDAQIFNPNYIKIVTKANTESDIARILSLYQLNRNLIAFNMGEIGRISRIASLYLGADFTYGAWSDKHKTAEGQWSHSEMKQIMSFFEQ